VISNLLIEGSSQKLRVSNYWLNLFETYCMFLEKMVGKKQRNLLGRMRQNPAWLRKSFFLTWL